MNVRSIKCAALVLLCLLNAALGYLLLTRDAESVGAGARPRQSITSGALTLPSTRDAKTTRPAPDHTDGVRALAVSRDGSCPIPAGAAAFYLGTGPVFDDYPMRLSPYARTLLGLPQEKLDQIDQLLNDVSSTGIEHQLAKQAVARNPGDKAALESCDRKAAILRATIERLNTQLDVILPSQVAALHLRSYLSRLLHRSKNYLPPPPEAVPSPR